MVVDEATTAHVRYRCPHTPGSRSMKTAPLLVISWFASARTTCFANTSFANTVDRSVWNSFPPTFSVMHPSPGPWRTTGFVGPIWTSFVGVLVTESRIPCRARSITDDCFLFIKQSCVERKLEVIRSIVGGGENLRRNVVLMMMSREYISLPRTQIGCSRKWPRPHLENKTMRKVLVHSNKLESL